MVADHRTCSHALLRAPAAPALLLNRAAVEQLPSDAAGAHERRDGIFTAGPLSKEIFDDGQAMTAGRRVHPPAGAWCVRDPRSQPSRVAHNQRDIEAGSRQRSRCGRVNHATEEAALQLVMTRSTGCTVRPPRAAHVRRAQLLPCCSLPVGECQWASTPCRPLGGGVEVRPAPPPSFVSLERISHTAVCEDFPHSFQKRSYPHRTKAYIICSAATVNDVHACHLHTLQVEQRRGNTADGRGIVTRSCLPRTHASQLQAGKFSWFIFNLTMSA
jgi:hypothetical protein